MPKSDHTRKPPRPAEERIEPKVRDDPRAEPISTGTPIARVALGSRPADKRISAAPTVRPADVEIDENALAALPRASMVEALLNEVPPPLSNDACEGNLRRIDELEALVATKERRVIELEALLAQENNAEVVQTELDNTRAHAARLEERVARLTRERDALRSIAGEVEALRASVDAAGVENAELEEKLDRERKETQRLAAEIARLGVAQNGRDSSSN
jgi:hypothetical protein